MYSLSDMVLDNRPEAGRPPVEFHRRRKPAWLRAKLPGGPGYQQLRRLVDHHGLHTVCESAKCPNMGECWARGTATIMILGDVCTRSCGFCHIKTGQPPVLDRDEPRRVGEAAALMGLRHLVITSVNRDELADGGAGIWAETIHEIRRQSPGTGIEVLIPDFEGNWEALQEDMETVRRLYAVVRPQAKYERSIELLRRAKAQGMVVKTGIMVGIGEKDEEVVELMGDVVSGSRVSGLGSREEGGGPESGVRGPGSSERGDAESGTGGAESWTGEESLRFDPCALHPTPCTPHCDILTIGQYLQPTRDHLPVSRWVTPEQFAEYKRVGEELGFGHVESGPLVRSSYHAEDQVLHLG